MNKNPIKCDVCGRFVPYSELESGESVHIMITPDSEVSCETWETLCKTHQTMEFLDES